MSNNKVYWKGFEELENDADFVHLKENEFAQDIPMDEFLSDEKTAASSTNRRDFLKFLGFSVTAATLAACETPIKKAIPYVVKPETITPGVPNYYASAYYDGSDYYGIMVKTREGRPIKIDGNKLCHVTQGATNARTQASILSLYDMKRAKGPMMAGAPKSWKEVDAEISNKLSSIALAGGKIVILSNTIISPSTNAVIGDFKNKFTNVQHIQYDAISYNAIREANASSFGKSVIPSYNFDKANAIVSFGADFLNGWLMSGVYEKQYAMTRKPENGTMSRHFQFEALMSLAGANADYRTRVKPSEIGVALVALYNYIAGKMGSATVTGGKLGDKATKDIAACGDYLIANKGKSLVVCGLNDVNAQLITNKINDMLGSYGNTINLNKEVNLYQGNDKAVAMLAEELKNKTVKAVILYGTNPAYTLPNGEEFNKLLGNAELTISFADRVEETNVQFVCPDHHYLEGWNDANPVKGHYVIQQPTIHPLFDTRSAQESLLVWAGFANRGDKNSSVYREYIKDTWKKALGTGNKATFSEFWNTTLHDGCYSTSGEVMTTVVEDPAPATVAPVVTPEPVTVVTAPTTSGSISDAASALIAMNASSKGWEFIGYEKVGIGNGSGANNPILQELPDPITRTVWDNYITMAPEDMDKLEFNKLMGIKKEANIAKLTINGKSLELPVIAVPGQAANTVGIALGYGRKIGKSEEVVGKNAYPFTTFNGTYFSTIALNANVDKTEGKYMVAGTQTHHTMMARDIIKETSLKEYQKNNRSGNPAKEMHTSVLDLVPEGNHKDEHGGSAPVGNLSYWREFKMINHRWGLSIDLNACNGCGACVVACHVENNVPVVGKDEVRRARDMHWLRIDRYYTSDADPKHRYESGIYNLQQAVDMEVPSNEPKVAFQPIMCQHCNHAPCETVCPVVATTHSLEGLNQMTYNRCVGTRYCANNCPYKVRRFNWFKYHDNAKFDYYMNDDLGKMVLNPDVTVRARGVMEKCSMCVQRIQAGKLEAKKESRLVKDQEIQTACSQACPTNAIMFGDYNDEKSFVTEQTKNPRSYYLLEEVGIKPNVIYQTKVRNVEEEYGHKDPHASGGHGNEETKKDDHSKENHSDHAH